MRSPREVCVAGVDVGSTLTKVVVHNGDFLAGLTGRTEPDYVRAAAGLLREALERAGRRPDELACVVATGYGRRRLPFADRQITEITCHARGVRELFPGARTIIDVGGQDAKGIKLGPAGKVVDFAMNDKCAAGTGRFLEVMAATLGLTLDELGARGLGAGAPVGVSSVCTVFAQQEVARHLAEGVATADVLAGLHAALASRIAVMVRRLRVEPLVVLTGGCARNPGLVRALEERLGLAVLIPADPLLTGALGAALLAGEVVAREPAPPRAARPEVAGAGRGAAGDRRPGTVATPGRAAARPGPVDGSFVLPPGPPPLAAPTGAVDVGALFTKAVVTDGARVSFAILPSEGSYGTVAGQALERALAVAGLGRERLAALAATGLGAARLPEARALSEVACLARGIRRCCPDVEHVIDIGGNGTRVIRLGPAGTVRDFVVSGQCAAGSARILEIVAQLLGVDVGALGALSLRSRRPATYAAGCAVFAETEAISLLTQGTTAEDLLAGLHQSLAAKIVALARAGRASGACAVTGGGARDAGLVAQLRAVLGPVAVPPEPMVVAALGGALLAAAGPE